MQETISFFSGFFSVETIIGLISAIVAGVVFIIYKNNRLSKIKNISDSINNEFQENVIKSLAEVVNLDEAIKDLPKAEKSHIVKQILTDKQKRFSLQIRLTAFGIAVLSIIILAIIGSQYYGHTDNKENNQIELVDLTFKDDVDSSSTIIDLKIVNNLTEAVIVKKAELLIKKSWALKKLGREPASYLEATGAYIIEIPFIENEDSIYKSFVTLSQSITPKSTDRFYVKVFFNEQLRAYLVDLNIYYNNEKKPILIKDILLSITPTKYVPIASDEERTKSLKFNLKTLDELKNINYSFANPNMERLIANAKTYK